MRRILFAGMICSWLLGACTQTPAPTPTVIPVTLTPSPGYTPSNTPLPSPTSKPSRTPKPSPTLPAVPEAGCIPTDSERISGIVTRVRDGDTIEVSASPFMYTVRYIGINTPEIHPIALLGPEAAARNRELVSGKRVTLVRDPNNDDLDRYNRLLRYVIVEDTFVNLLLVREGLAFLYPSGHSCGLEFTNAYLAAQADKVGLFAGSGK